MDSGYKVAFVSRGGEPGLIEGQNLTHNYRSAEGHADKLPGLAAELLPSGCPHLRQARTRRGQGADLLETRVWDALSDRVASYSASRSFRTAAI